MKTISQQEADRIRRSKRMLRKLARECPPEGLRYSAYLEPLMVALADPRFGEGTLELLAASYASATSGGQRECFCCRGLWSSDRGLAAVLVVEIIQGGEGALVAGVCCECCASDRCNALALAGLKRDLGGDITIAHAAHPIPA